MVSSDGTIVAYFNHDHHDDSEANKVIRRACRISKSRRS